MRATAAPLRVWCVLSRIVIGVVGVAGAAVVGVPGIAAADPPPLPNINAFPSARPSDYSVMDGAWYAFGALDGVTCVLDKQSGGYGCSGPIPAARTWSVQARRGSLDSPTLPGRCMAWSKTRRRCRRIPGSPSARSAAAPTGLPRRA